MELKINGESRRARGPMGTMWIDMLSVWRGPASIDSQLEDGSPFWGHCVLYLALRVDDYPDRLLAARSVYANLYDDSQPTAVLRFMAASRLAQRDALNSHGARARFSIPVRHNWISRATVDEWIATLTGTSTSIAKPIPNNSPQPHPIRRLLVQYDPATCVFDQTWEVMPGTESQLNQHWIDIWNQMGQIAHEATSVGTINEDYTSNDAPVVAGFDPESDLPLRVRSDGTLEDEQMEQE